jgi:DNA-directed RNA polymerase subunit M/transcription elongation factor TFIIS
MITPIEEYCPECCIELINNRKKLGKGSSKWLICPKCGYRIKDNYLVQFESIIEKVNKLKEFNLEELEQA